MHPETAGPTIGLVDTLSLTRPPRVPGRLAIAMRALLRAFLAGYRRHRTERALCFLSDASLTDIGLRRSDIRAVADALANGRRVPRRIER